MPGTHARGTEKGVAADALVGFHGDYAQLFGTAECGTDTGFPGAGSPVEHIDFDVGYFHGTPAFIVNFIETELERQYTADKQAGDKMSDWCLSEVTDGFE
jgi:hypothetical protein